jgi:hypothetical protein
MGDIPRNQAKYARGIRSFLLDIKNNASSEYIYFIGQLSLKKKEREEGDKSNFSFFGGQGI